MSKRITRLLGKEIQEKLQFLSGKDINVVLNNGNTFFGQLVTYSNTRFSVEDYRKYQHKFDISEVEAVIYDEIAPW